MQRAIIMKTEQLPQDSQWLSRQTCPVIAYGPDETAVNADVVVADLAAAETLQQRVETWPIAALTLVQVLRSTELLPAELGLDVESLAYATLQSGEEFINWQSETQLDELPQAEGEPILLSREGNRVEAVLNRPMQRNSMTVELREAWINALQLLEADESIDEFHIRGAGACFSVGGELREFGTRPNPAIAHWVRTVHSPARMLHKLKQKLTFFLHGACLGSGIELPAFAAHVVAHSKTFFQLPELQLGLIPGAGGTVSIARRIGRQRLAWMVLSGRRINAQTALEWGLVDEITDWY